MIARSCDDGFRYAQPVLHATNIACRSFWQRAAPIVTAELGNKCIARDLGAFAATLTLNPLPAESGRECLMGFPRKDPNRLALVDHAMCADLQKHRTTFGGADVGL